MKVCSTYKGRNGVSGRAESSKLNKGEAGHFT